jgi:hypothetical protein
MTKPCFNTDGRAPRSADRAGLGRGTPLRRARRHHVLVISRFSPEAGPLETSRRWDRFFFRSPCRDAVPRYRPMLRARGEDGGRRGGPVGRGAVRGKTKNRSFRPAISPAPSRPVATTTPRTVSISVCLYSVSQCLCVDTDRHCRASGCAAPPLSCGGAAAACGDAPRLRCSRPHRGRAGGPTTPALPPSVQGSLWR